MERRKMRGHTILPIGIILLMLLLSGFYSIGTVKALLYSGPEPPSRTIFDSLNLLSPPIGLYPPMSPADPSAYPLGIYPGSPYGGYLGLSSSYGLYGSYYGYDAGSPYSVLPEYGLYGCLYGGFCSFNYNPLYNSFGDWNNGASYNPIISSLVGWNTESEYKYKVEIYPDLTGYNNPSSRISSSFMSNMFNPYSVNITNPYIVSLYRGWYPPGLFQYAFFPTLMIYVPRKPDPEPAPPPENLFPDDIELPKQLTSSERDSKPFWSPDGNHIAFLSLRNTYNPNFSIMRFELWVMEKDGSNQRPILSIDDLDEGSRILYSKVSWAKNSNELLMSVYNSNTSEIWSVSLDGNKSRLSSIDDWAGFPLYSFDGSKIAFVVQEPNPIQGPVGRLYIANSDYSEHILIDEGILYDFAWKSDSQGLIYSKNYDLWEYSISENKKTQFSETPEDEEHPSCSSDGKYIAFSAQNAVYITPALTFQPKKLIEGARLSQWIPNRYLLDIGSVQTLNNESFWTESWIIDLEGNIIKKIAEGTFTELDFAPNGEHFVYSLYGDLWLDHIP